MKHTVPPFLLDSLLRFLLPTRNRETVSGDLYEEFLESKLPDLGLIRAQTWYLRQVISFVPAWAVAMLLQGPALNVLCLCTALSAGWLGIMDLLLRHIGYESQLVIAATILLQSSLTLAALRFPRYTAIRTITKVCSLALLWLATKALQATIRGANVEGYILLISMALVGQTVLTLFTLPITGSKGTRS